MNLGPVFCRDSKLFYFSKVRGKLKKKKTSTSDTKKLYTWNKSKFKTVSSESKITFKKKKITLNLLDHIYKYDNDKLT